MRKLQRLRPVDVLRQHRVPATDRHRLAKQPEVGENDRRNKRVVFNAVGIEDVETVDAAEIHLAGPCALVEGRENVELVALKTVQDIVVPESLCLRVEAGQAVVGADPQLALRVFQDAFDGVVGQAFLLGVDRRALAFGPVESTQAAGGAHPELTSLVFMQDSHSVVGQAGQILRIAPIPLEGFCRRVEPVETTAFRRHPQGVRPVFVDVGDRTASQAVRVARVVPELPERFR